METSNDRRADVLLVYASSHGQTAKIAARIARGLEERGARVDVCDIASARDLVPFDYDVVVVGASIHLGRHQHEIVDWVKRHSTSLNGMPAAFFSVCLTAAEDGEEAHRTVQDLVDDFIDDTGWTPRTTASFAGALQYLEYGFLTRLAMRVKMSQEDQPTDVSRDYEYTDWDAVDRFADDCAAMLAVPHR